MMKNNSQRNLFIFIGILFITVLFAIFNGAVSISLGKILSGENQVIFHLRLLRILAAVVLGSGLAVSGIVLQAILKNPLAEPYLLGTSSGAGLAAVISILIGLSRLYLPVAAFLGAILSVVIVYSLAKQNNKVSQQSLILSGVIVSVAFSAIIVFLISISGDLIFNGLTWWLWGSLQIYDLKLLLIVSALVFGGISVIYIFSQDLNAISIGEEEAMHLGIDIEKTKKILIMLVSLITASLVCICGIVGFVGLIIPHMMRLVVGPNHKTLIPFSCLAASIFMIACDMIARSIMPPVEIPTGVITAIIGAPVFIILLKRAGSVK